MNPQKSQRLIGIGITLVMIVRLALLSGILYFLYKVGPTLIEWTIFHLTKSMT